MHLIIIESKTSSNMQKIKIFNTMARQKTVLVPIDNNRVTMYVCGPTVYNRAHIGNFRPAIVFDVMAKLLRTIYGKENVIYARNITDIDDKINAAALEAGVEIGVITEKFTQIYHDDMKRLNVEMPDIEPKVTGHINEIIELVSKLIELGHAYRSDDGVYFHVPSMENYARLSGRNLDEMRSGARVDIDENKKDPADFALWKAAKPDEPFWESPFGNGRPGWHIECSAMIAKNLGQTIDIHGGGHDLIFPHHENEIAQSECAHQGVKLANIWMHNGFLNMGSEKMSKSLGNVLNIEELCNKFPPEAIRFAMLSAHYRAPLDWNDELIERSVKTLDRLYRVLDYHDDTPPTNCPGTIDALCDDLNTPKALAELSRLARDANKAKSGDEKCAIIGELKAAGNLLGVLQLKTNEWFAKKADQTGDDITTKVNALVEERTNARAQKDWARADEIRKELGELGVEITDAGGQTNWRFIN